MTEDPRCCGSGTCIIDREGRCWCGQQWNGQTMAHPAPKIASASAPALTPADPAPPVRGASGDAAGD